MMRWLSVAIVLLGCTPVRFNSGSSCSLNSDCDPPLVCQLDRCRRQCIDSRDCGAGLRCLALGGDLGGACQLPEEVSCGLTSNCPPGLVCRFGTCTTECMGDRDCTPGSRCMAEPDAGMACTEPITSSCIYNSDCGEPYVCGPDQLCHIECITSRDCVPPRTCDSRMRCSLPYDGGI